MSQAWRPHESAGVFLPDISACGSHECGEVRIGLSGFNSTSFHSEITMLRHSGKWERMA
jgi:hypothetical protein